MECQKNGCNAKPTFKVTFTPAFNGVETVYVCGTHKKIFEEAEEEGKCTIKCIYIESNPDLLIAIDTRETALFKKPDQEVQS